MNYRCVITSPLGTELNVSDLLEIGDMGVVSWAPESDLSIMSHGDMKLVLDNSEGRVEDLLGSAQPVDLYEVILDREGDSGWERVFGGVLDLPYSLVYDDKAKLAAVQCYSFSKLLERASAEPIKRTLATKTASITATTRALAFLTGEAADLLPGDIVKLDNGAGQVEEMTIDKVTTTSAATVTKAASGTFAAALVTVQTPYYIDETPSHLLDLVATESGLELDSADLTADLATFPIATPVSRKGLDITQTPSSVVPTGTSISATYVAALETKRKTSTSPSVAWTDGATSNDPQGDWRPYLTSEPASIMSSSLGGFYDAGAMAWDHTNSHVFRIVQETTGSPAFLLKLHVYKDAADLGVFVSMADSESFETQAIEYDPVNDRVWVSYSNTLGARLIRWTSAAGGGYTTFDAARSGKLRLCRSQNALILLDDVTGDLRFYDLTSFALARTVVFTLGTPDIWTVRTWDQWFAFVYTDSGMSRIAIYETAGWTFVAAYILSKEIHYRQYLTVQSLSDGRSVGIVFAGGEWAVLSLRFDGVVRYADFDGASCGAAARDLAIIANAIVDVDDFKVLSIRNRMNLGSGEVAFDIGSPLDSARRPVSEIYRASVEVLGKSPGGTEISVIVGDTGDSARRLEITSNLSTTTGAAVAAAIATFQFVGSVRTQYDVSIEDTGTPIRFGDRLSFGGRTLFAYRGSRDLEQQTQALMLLEVLA